MGPPSKSPDGTPQNDPHDPHDQPTVAVGPETTPFVRADDGRKVPIRTAHTISARRPTDDGTKGLARTGHPTAAKRLDESPTVIVHPDATATGKRTTDEGPTVLVHPDATVTGRRTTDEGPTVLVRSEDATGKRVLDERPTVIVRSEDTTTTKRAIGEGSTSLGASAIMRVTEDSITAPSVSRSSFAVPRMSDDSITAPSIALDMSINGKRAGEVGFAIGPGTMLGEYQIEGVIGEGAMGTVFAAVHPVILKRVAIKVLKRELCANPQSVERFVNEARVVNEIGHRNIVDVFAFGDMPDGRHYFVMEWLRGETLLARLARSTLTLREMCAVVRPLTRALMAAHDKGVIHRDLKPDNVFLVEDGREEALVKLLDFGIAKLGRVEFRVERTAEGVLVGTPQYIAPEQAKGYAIDGRADVYSLGCMMFEMLAGRPPFVADNAAEMLAMHLMQPVPRVSMYVSAPSELDELLIAMLAKEPYARPSLDNVAAVLDRIHHKVASSVEPVRGMQLQARLDDGLAERTRKGYAPPVPVLRVAQSRHAVGEVGRTTADVRRYPSGLARLTEYVRSPRGRWLVVGAACLAAVIALIVVVSALT